MNPTAFNVVVPAANSVVLIKAASAKPLPGLIPKTIRPGQRDQIAARFAFVGCIKDGGASDAKLAEDYLYGEGEVP